MALYYVYMLRCEDDSLYTGITSDISRRMREHCGKTAACAKYTRSHPVKELSALWTTDDRSSASRAEVLIKKLDRGRKCLLINQPHRIADILGIAVKEGNYTPVPDANLAQCIDGSIDKRLGKEPATMNHSVIFDMDGVIFDTENIFLNSWRTVAKRNDLGDIDELIFRCIGTNETQTRDILIDHFGGAGVTDRLRTEVADEFSKVEHTTGVPLKTGVYEIIRYLRAQRCKLGLASSTRYEIVSMRLKQAGIFDCFDAVVTGDMVCRSKPEPDIFLLCAQQMGAVPCNTYVIEDSFNGITAAHRAGMIPIMVPDLKQPDEHIRSLSAAVKDDLLQALEFFKENN